MIETCVKCTVDHEWEDDGGDSRDDVDKCQCEVDLSTCMLTANVHTLKNFDEINMKKYR